MTLNILFIIFGSAFQIRKKKSIIPFIMSQELYIKTQQQQIIYAY